MRSFFARTPVATRIVGTYAILGSAWIVVSDMMLDWGRSAPVLAHLHDSIKGLLFVAVTAFAFHTVIRRLVERFEAAETALRAVDERWNLALDGHGVWDWNGETHRTYFSPRWKAMLGYSEAEIGDSNDEWENRIHPDDYERVFAELRRHYAGATESYRSEHRLRTKSGSYIWVLSHGRVIRRAPDGRPLRAVGTHTDISPQKAFEARLKDALGFNATILDSAPVGIIAYRADGRTVSANEAAAQLVGTSVDGLLMQNFRRLESWQRFGLVEAADRALAENRVTFHRTKLETTFGRNLWVELRFAPFVYEGEQRLLVIIHDMTEQRAVFERLQLLHAALEAAPTGWVVTDATGTIEWVNPAFTKLTGYSAEEAVGQKPSLLKSARHSAGFYANLWQTVKSGQTWQGEICNRRKDGTHYYERMTVAPVRDATNAIAHFVAMKEDITGQHELELQLARSQRLESIGLLASGIAHDLNNMLAPIVLSVNLIKARHRDRETAQLLDMMEVAAQRGASVVQQVLTFARGVEGERVQLDARLLLKELAQLARETFPREIRVVVDVPSSPLLIEGDVTQLHQVLLNLSVNARDAMPEGGVLTLRAQVVKLDETAARLAPGSRVADYARLSVIDTGTGIPPEIQERIFEPFYTTKPRGKGTGLGLSTVYGIVRSHDGFVDVKSTVGEGTEFGVMIPLDVAPPPAASTPPDAIPLLDGAGRRVLVVDDEDGIRRVLCQVLRRREFVVVEAADGHEALRRLRESRVPFSLAVVDLMMPGMNGYKLVREIRDLVPGMPVIVASGMMGDGTAGQDGAALAAMGVRSILTKPFGEAELVEALTAELAAPVG